MKVCFLLEYKRKALLIKAAFCDAFVWSLNTNEVCEVAAMANFNLNKTQSLNDALRAIYMEEEGGGISWPLEEGSETNPNSCFSTHTDSKSSLYLSIFENTWAWPNNKVTQHLK